MTDKRIAKQHHATFEGIRQLDADGNEYLVSPQARQGLGLFRVPSFLARH